jgi:hypothetical protein
MDEILYDIIQYNMSSNIILNISEKEQHEAHVENVDNSHYVEEKVSLYIQQLTEQQKIVLNIAKEHLATSFCIEKSLGYLNWLKLHN